MSIIEIEPENIIDFHYWRRELVIKKIIELNHFPKEQIQNIIKMHSFLTQVDTSARHGSVDQKTLDKIEEEIIVVKEKFEELFEMIKDQLFIDGRWRI